LIKLISFRKKSILPLSDDSRCANVLRQIIIADTETTYKLWDEVYIWALKNGYSFANPGREGSWGISGRQPKEVNNEQVTGISWRDFIVWCNVLTEFYNEHNSEEPGLDCVYYTDKAYTKPLRRSTDKVTGTKNPKGSEDCPYIKADEKGNHDANKGTAIGFRLPTSVEWDFAARFRGTDSTNSILSNGAYYTKGDVTRGSICSTITSTVTNDILASIDALAWYHNNSHNTTHGVNEKLPNTLGLYDMSGNVAEWCFDWANEQNSGRILRGDTFETPNHEMPVSYTMGFSTRFLTNSFGFRVVRNYP